ncbi:MAG: hypothetical protein M3T56_12700, partial [Chloroflexota bacterium]|nr:hypothetical protein [Chloroflexota bacterium]
MRLIVVLVVGLLPMVTLAGPAAARENDRQQHTMVTTTLAAAGVTTGAKITVLTGTAVTDQATLTGARAKARGEIRYRVFSDPNCKSLVFD